MEDVKKFLNAVFPANLLQDNFVEVIVGQGSRIVQQNRINSVETIAKGLLKPGIRDYTVVYSPVLKCDEPAIPAYLTCLWAQINNKNFTDFTDKAVMDAIAMPDYLVGIPGIGADLYWILEEPVKLSNEDDIKEANAKLEGIAVILKANKDVANVNAYLHLPGSYFNKQGTYIKRCSDIYTNSNADKV